MHESGHWLPSVNRPFLERLLRAGLPVTRSYRHLPRRALPAPRCSPLQASSQVGRRLSRFWEAGIVRSPAPGPRSLLTMTTK